MFIPAGESKSLLKQRLFRSRSNILLCTRVSNSQTQTPSTEYNKALKTIPALKEWSPIVSALGKKHAMQTILFRKGGIKEPLFRPIHRSFLLFPTSFHTEASLLKPDAQLEFKEDCLYDPKQQEQLVFKYIARCSGAWLTTDPTILNTLNPLHIYNENFLEKRLRWRAAQPLTIMELCVYRLREPLLVVPDDSFWGCFSWIDIPVTSTTDDIHHLIGTSDPVLQPDEFKNKQRILRDKLLQIKDSQLQELVLP